MERGEEGGRGAHEEVRGRPERKGFHSLLFHCYDAMQPQPVEVDHAAGTWRRVREKRQIHGSDAIRSLAFAVGRIHVEVFFIELRRALIPPSPSVKKNEFVRRMKPNSWDLIDFSLVYQFKA